MRYRDCSNTVLVENPVNINKGTYMELQQLKDIAKYINYEFHHNVGAKRLEEELIEQDEEESEEILMTEQKAKEIDNLTRSTIQREEFDAELKYLKKKGKRDDDDK